MQYNFAKLKTELAATESWLIKELGTIRTNRANPAILDSVRVEAYGADMPISGVASTSTSPSMAISASCTMPSPLMSTMLIRGLTLSTLPQYAIQPGKSEKWLPTRVV